MCSLQKALQGAEVLVLVLTVLDPLHAAAFHNIEKKLHVHSHLPIITC